ncbi:hypothetical protein DIPPA_16415 [Diplonema papillatum]|nr:hypothetical protein DIPPA_16415 [Diplonema papillatum]
MGRTCVGRDSLAAKTFTGVSKRVKEQWDVAQHFLHEDVFRGAIIMIWVASFGGALHAPVTAFYYLELGATEMDIGIFSMIAAGGSVLLSPLYGWLLDLSGSFPVMTFSCFLCAMGCLVRGLATDTTACLIGVALLGLGGGNLWIATLSHITRHTSEARRNYHVTGYLVQVGVLRIAGKALYPVADGFFWAIGFREDLPRFRMNMAVCTVFCFVGIFILFKHRDKLSQPVSTDIQPLVEASRSPTQSPASAVEPQAERSLSNVATSGDCECEPERLAQTERTAAPASHTISLVLCAVALSGMAISNSVITLLWPLFLHEQYKWSPVEYSYVLFASSILVTAFVSAAPYLEGAHGHFRSAIALSILASATAVAAFTAPVYAGGTFAGKSLHVAGAISAFACFACLEPIIKSVASLYALPSSQARAFGALASAQGIGDMVGSYCGASLYKVNKGTPASAVLPMVLLVVPMAVAVAILSLLTLPKTSLEKSESTYSDDSSPLGLPADFDAPVVRGGATIRHRRADRAAEPDSELLSL